MSEVNNMQWSPEEYKASAFLAQEAGVEMISRLEWMKLEPKVIADVGCGLGEVAAELAKRYPAATVYAVDQSSEMLNHVPQQSNLKTLQEDAAKLSLPDHSVDLLCANFLLPWVDNIGDCLREWRRVLAPHGLLMLSLLGAGTLPQLQNVLSREQLPHLLDMHDLGDAIVGAGFADPVLDSARNPVRYRDIERMQSEWHASGILLSEAMVPLTELEVIFEVVHAHAFAPPTAKEFKADEAGVVRIPLSHLRTMR